MTKTRSSLEFFSLQLSKNRAHNYDCRTLAKPASSTFRPCRGAQPWLSGGRAVQLREHAVLYRERDARTGNESRPFMSS